MAPKNKKKNGFFFFMKEMQEAEERRGVRVTMSTLPNLAHPQWKKLSLVEREKYEELAKKYNHDPNMRGGKLASDGTSLEAYQNEIDEEIRKENAMKHFVKMHVNVDSDKDLEQCKDRLSHQKFYFISFNILCQVDTDDFLPNEIGLVEYSIKYGIHRTFHRFIHIGSIPTGFAGDAKRHSEKHMINAFGMEGSERNMKKLYQDIKEFMDADVTDNPLFVKEEDYVQNLSCLSYIARRAGDSTRFEVWKATYLLMELRHGVGHTFPSVGIAADMLNKPSFNYNASARCDFHEEEDVHYCALAYSKCLCFLFSDALCDLFDVIPTERHMPPRCAEEKQYIVTTFHNPLAHRQMENSVSSFGQRNNYHQPKSEQPSWKTPAPAPVQASLPKPQSQPRQPTTTCLAAEMSRLNLNMSAAKVPGIGRGQRKQ